MIAHVYKHEMTGDGWQVVYEDGYESWVKRLSTVRDRLSINHKLIRGMHPDPGLSDLVAHEAGVPGFTCYHFQANVRS